MCMKNITKPKNVEKLLEIIRTRNIIKNFSILFLIIDRIIKQTVKDIAAISYTSDYQIRIET